MRGDCGHDPADVYVRPNGWRTCRECKRERDQRRARGEVRAPNAFTTRCVRDHDLTDPENVRVYRGRRVCLACLAERSAARRTGRPKGRPAWVPTDVQRQAVVDGVTSWRSLEEIAADLGVNDRTLMRALRRDAEWSEEVRRARQTRGPRRHGTPTAYNFGCRCDDCRKAHAEYALLLRRRRRELTAREGLPSNVAHGASAYGNWGCRCEVCSAAHAEALARRTVKPHQHGTPTGYFYGCRCEPCRGANRRHMQARKERAA